ncbi:glycosyltransferase [Microbacterium sp. A82]|uniref:glycosyltransferase n=1 Tax=Microbacterium sp. A82 TaxID=3450452 RepID=UPI003F3228C2
MSTAPLVSIIVPVYNDEATIAATLDSALAQSLSEIEIICVDDASTDASLRILESYQERDPRVRVIRHDRNLSALQSRRTGALSASADYLLVLDGDDELEPNAARVALELAHEAEADLVGFGVTVIEKDGRTGGSYEGRLQPAHRVLDGAAVLQGLFPIGKPAQGQLWRYLFRTDLFRSAYTHIADGTTLARVNDLPLMFLIAALATRYVSTETRLYRYHFGRGGSGQQVDTIERAEFYASAIASIDLIRPAVDVLAETYSDPALLRESYESTRLSIVGYVCSQLIDRSDSTVLDDALSHLHTVASADDIVRGTARFYPAKLSTLKFHLPAVGTDDSAVAQVRSVALVTSSLRSGGVTMVMLAQAHYLRQAGFEVILVARSGGSDRTLVPAGTTFIELSGRTFVERLQDWAAICRRHQVDMVIDHQLLYTDRWPEFALMARAEHARTIGWIHNSFARPLYDGNDRLSLIEKCSNALARLVTLSPLDSAYFALRGVSHSSYLPNPPSPLLNESLSQSTAKKSPAGHIELVWWGRLEDRTKKVLDLIEVAVQLKAFGVSFHLTVIGPDWEDMTAKRFNAHARRRGVSDCVKAVGPLRGARLTEAIDAADAFVSTSIIEGYQLTIAEAQARGLPVFMYELPWLLLTQQNEGVVAVRQSDPRALAAKIAEVAGNPVRYQQLSHAAVEAAKRARDYDFAALYRGVVTDTLPAEFSPQPSLEDAKELLGLSVFYSERARSRGKSPLSVPTSRGARAWSTLAPAGRAVLGLFPRLRPMVHRVKQRLRVD